MGVDMGMDMDMDMVLDSHNSFDNHKASILPPSPLLVIGYDKA
jgi:hypothetical protein